MTNPGLHQTPIIATHTIGASSCFIHGRKSPFRKAESSFFAPEHPSRFPRVHFETGRRRFTNRVSSFPIPNYPFRDRNLPSRDPYVAFSIRRAAGFPAARIPLSRGDRFTSGNNPFTIGCRRFTTAEHPFRVLEHSFLGPLHTGISPSDVFRPGRGYHTRSVRALHSRDIPLSSSGQRHRGPEYPIQTGKNGISYHELRSHDPEMPFRGSGTPLHEQEMSLHEPEIQFRGLQSPLHESDIPFRCLQTPLYEREMP